MKHNRKWTGLWVFLGMLLLILDGKTALSGGREGLDLCIQAVIPSLFPFLVLSSLLMDTAPSGASALLTPLRKLCRLPEGAEPFLIPAFLGGYPVGAQSIGAAFQKGQADRETAQRMLAFCSNCGPGFLFGMAAVMFAQPWMPWALWGIHIASAILVSRSLPRPSGRIASAPFNSGRGISQALGSSVKVMGLICGWVLLFRIVIGFLKRWILWLAPEEIQVILIGLLELTNGCFELSRIADPALRFLVCSGMLACGGLCVTMQTRSVTNGLSLKYYYRGKALQTVFSLLFSGCIFYPKLLFPLAIFLLFALFPRKKEKRSGIPKALGV